MMHLFMTCLKTLSVASGYCRIASRDSMIGERHRKYLEGSDYRLISGIIPLSRNPHSRQQVCNRIFEYSIQSRNGGNSPKNCSDEFVEI